jgi:hypothetical protein
MIDAIPTACTFVLALQFPFPPKFKHWTGGTHECKRP